MSLSEDELDRLADVVRLQPTKNAELGDRWNMADGSEVHRYLEEHLGDYYYRDENSLIRATEEAAELTGAEPGVEQETDGVPGTIRVSALQARVFEVLAGPDGRSESVVSVLQSLRDAFDVDPGADAVREALGALRRKDVVEVVYRSVPTYRRAVEEANIEVEVVESPQAQ